MEKKKSSSKQKTILWIILGAVMLTYMIYNMIDLIQWSKAKKEWTEERISNVKEVTRKGVIASFPIAADYPEIVSEYCDCIIDTIIKHYNYEEYLDLYEMDPQDVAIEVNRVIKPCVDKLNQKIEPYKTEIDYKASVNNCANRAMITGNLDSIQAKKYCECMIDYLQKKYGRLDSLNIDSINNVEVAQISKCLEKAKN